LDAAVRHADAVSTGRAADQDRRVAGFRETQTEGCPSERARDGPETIRSMRVPPIALESGRANRPAFWR